MNEPHIHKEDVLRNMRRIGHHPDEVRAASQALPDLIDLDRDHLLMERFGITRSTVMEQLGGSP